jgi:phosphate transporter
MASPISSPQNLIALEYMNPPISWLGWFAVSIPVASTSIFFIWLILLWSYRKGSDVIINPVRINREKWRGEQWFVAIVTIVTIVLWCVEASLKDIVGDMGIIAIFPIVAFYGSGVLRKVRHTSS